jgi:phosphatidylglycerophosphate synthase
VLALIVGNTDTDDARPAVGPPLIGGLSLVERAVLAAQRAGVTSSVVVAPDPDGSVAAPLRARGADASFIDWTALRHVDSSAGLLLINDGVLVEPRAVAKLLDSWTAEEGPGVLMAVGGAGDPDLAVVPASAADALMGATSARDFMARLGHMGPWDLVSVAPFFCRRIEPGSDRGAVETAYIQHQNGRESFFTKKIRKFSVPLSRVFARRGVGPNQITFMGLLLATGAAMAISADVYLISLLGAFLYYASMILDCSDGEVARLTFRDSRFGAWFETVVDYVTYFLLLGGLVLASQLRGDGDLELDFAMIAVVGSLIVVAVAGYLRQRVAGKDPGQFDDASAAALRRSTPFHRFARWGRQWIKRSTIAHLVVAFAIVDQLWVLIYLWAFGAVVASGVILAVEPFVVRRVKVAAPGARSARA